MKRNSFELTNNGNGQKQGNGNDMDFYVIDNRCLQGSL